MSENITLAVPFFRVRDMQVSLAFYREGLGFRMTNQWVVDGRVRWCWIDRGGSSLMLQEWHPKHAPRDGERVGLGVSIAFQCEDATALYHEFGARGLDPSLPEVGNRMWVTSLSDPDGYRLEFASFTDAPEESRYNPAPS